MYKVVPWDYDDELYFDTFIDALQYGNAMYGSRYDLIDLEEEGGAK